MSRRRTTANVNSLHPESLSCSENVTLEMIRIRVCPLSVHQSVLPFTHSPSTIKTANLPSCGCESQSKHAYLCRSPHQARQTYKCNQASREHSPKCTATSGVASAALDHRTTSVIPLRKVLFPQPLGSCQEKNGVLEPTALHCIVLPSHKGLQTLQCHLWNGKITIHAIFGIIRKLFVIPSYRSLSSQSKNDSLRFWWRRFTRIPTYGLLRVSRHALGAREFSLRKSRVGLELSIV